MDTISIFESSKDLWLEEAREVAHRLLKRKSRITIEDVLQIHPLPRELHRNTIGSVFSQKEFKLVGYEPSRKASSHGRVIGVWGEKVRIDRETQSFDAPKHYSSYFRRQEVME